MTNIIDLLPWSVWALIVFAVAAAALTFELAAFVYNTLPQKEDLIKGNPNFGDISVRILGTLTEPDAIPYFPAWSTDLKYKIRSYTTYSVVFDFGLYINKFSLQTVFC